MRVLIVHNRYRSDAPSGENRVVEREVDELRARGIDVETHIRSSDEIDGMPFGQRVGVAFGTMRAPGGAAVLDRVLTEARPDVVHLHNVYPLVSPAIVTLAHRHSIPVVQTVHNYRHPCMSGWLHRDDRYCDDCVGRRFPLPGVVHGCYRGSRVQSLAMAAGRWRHQSTWRAVDRMLAISGFVRDRLLDDGFDPDRVSVKHNFAPDPGLVPDWSTREPLVAFSARLASEKGVDAVLDAWRDARLPDHWRLAIAGDGPLRPLVAAAALQDPRIEAMGQLPATGVTRLLHRASIALVASSAADPGTLAIPEAFACGTPVIAVDVGGVSELLGHAGRLATRGTLADALASLASPRLATDLAALGVRARARYESTFSPAVVMPQLVATYENVIDAAAGDTRMSKTTGGVTSLAVLITCHNRRDLTLRCLRSLRAQDSPVPLTVFLVDDGSTDGTGDAVRAQFPEVWVIPGTGELYWVGGMRVVYSAAVEAGFEDVLWLNDDVELVPTAISTAMGVLAGVNSPETPAIVVGAVQDPVDGTTSYSGLGRVGRFRRLVHERVEPGDVPIRCDTMHGNVVLVSGGARLRLGNLDEAFTHAMADTDYGLRARRRGCAVWLAPGHQGTCAFNYQRSAWRTRVPRDALACAVLGAKGRPVREWLRLTWRHGGPLWFVHVLAPYARAFFGRPPRRRSLTR